MVRFLPLFWIGVLLAAAPAGAQTVEVSAEPAPSELLVGDSLELTVTWQGPHLPPDGWPDQKALQGNFARLEAGPVHVVRTGEQYLWRRSYHLEPWLPGSYQGGRVLLPDGSEARGSGLAVQVTGQAMSESPELKPWPEQADSGLRAQMAWVGLGSLVVLGGVGLLLWRPWKRKPVFLPAEEPSTYFEDCKTRLHTLDREGTRQLYRKLVQAWEGPLAGSKPDLALAFFYRPGMTWESCRHQCFTHATALQFAGAEVDFADVEADLDAVMFFFRQGGPGVQ